MNACRCLTVILIVAAMASAAAAQVGPGGGGGTNCVGVPKSSVVDIDQRISALKYQGKQIETRLSSVKQQIRDAKDPDSAALAPAGGQSLNTQAAQLTEEISQLARDLAEMERLKTLASPVDITLKSSTIRQAAEALSRASKLSITVDPKVPQDFKVNAVAQNIPLGAILEVIANAAGIIIAPTEDGGLLLRLPGKLVVDGNSYTTDGNSAPWSDDWGIAGMWASSSVGRKYLGLFNTYFGGALPLARPDGVALPSVPSGPTPPSNKGGTGSGASPGRSW